MTVQEAKIKQIEITKQILDEVLSCSKGVDAFFEVLSESLEKQIPKKPIPKAMDGFDFDVAAELCCPSCSSPIVNVWSKAEYQPRYCHYCGQALKWR